MADLRVKICGLVREEDARAADDAGADFLGVVLSPGFSRSVDPSSAHRLVDGVRAKTVAVLVDEPLGRALAAARSLRASVIQLHGNEPPEFARRLQAEGDWAVWKSVSARSSEDVAATVARYGNTVAAILVEGWREGVVGGGGAVLEVDGAAVRACVPNALDLVLAGGLTAATVADAVARFAPDVVDVSSGVERERGRKDHILIRAFVDAARAAAPMNSDPSDRTA